MILPEPEYKAKVCMVTPRGSTEQKCLASGCGHWAWVDNREGRIAVITPMGQAAPQPPVEGAVFVKEQLVIYEGQQRRQWTFQLPPDGRRGTCGLIVQREAG